MTFCRIITPLITMAILTLAPVLAHAQAPTEQELSTLKSKHQQFKKLVKPRPSNSDQAILNDQVELCDKAIEWLLRHPEEFFEKNNTVAKADKVLKTGQNRASKLASLKRPEQAIAPGFKTVWAYRSEVDNSLQPVAISFPKNYSNNQAWPVYIHLHGRDGKPSEVNFIDAHDGKPTPDTQTWVQIDVFGRTNNAFRWAGETDIFEALKFTRKLIRVDERKVVLWGFSMGGAGAWHLGLHHPTKFSVVGAGAGFIDTYGYQKITTPFAEPVNSLLRIYDAKGYATNLDLIPFVTYGGDQDSQLLAGKTMKEQADALDVPLTLIIGKNIGHKFTPEAEKEFQQFLAEHNKAGRPLPATVKSVRFTTFTPKYNQADWLSIEEMDEMYQQAIVEGKVDAEKNLVELTTDNVRALQVMRDMGETITIDGDGPFPLAMAAENRLPGVYFVNNGTAWSVLDYNVSREFEENRQVHKRQDLQGPIDDAFMSPFVCVKGTSTPWNAEHQKWSDWTFKRFDSEFDKWMRGDVPVIKDTELTDELIRDKHLVLFGDPGSNSQIAKIMAALPVSWTKTELKINDKTYPLNEHGVSLIFPNPLNMSKYVVINSGMTMHEKDFKGTNALLYPKLGDIAVIKFKTTAKGAFEEEVLLNDYFDSDWKWRAEGANP